MGIDKTFAHAFLKSQEATGNFLPTSGKAFISVKDADKKDATWVAQNLDKLGFSLVATHGTAAYLKTQGITCEGINKVQEGQPHCVDALQNGDISLVVNTTEGTQAIKDSHSLRRAALVCDISYFTTIRGARAAVESIQTLINETYDVSALQNYHGETS